MPLYIEKNVKKCKSHYNVIRDCKSMAEENKALNTLNSPIMFCITRIQDTGAE